MIISISPVNLTGFALVLAVAGVEWPVVPVAVVTDLKVSEWCGDVIGGGAKLGTRTGGNIYFLAGLGCITDDKMVGGG